MIKKYVDRISREGFLNIFREQERPEDWFSEEELRLHPFPKNAGSLAARYLVKKRILEQTRVNARMNEIQILNDEYGKPEIVFDEKVKKELKNKGIDEILCSLSHSRNHIVAMTIMENEF